MGIGRGLGRQARHQHDPRCHRAALDPVAQGLVASPARPGGNITGVASAPVGGQGKTVQVLTEALPGLSRVALLWSSANPAHTLMVREAQEAAQGLGLKPQLLDVREASELDGAFAAMAQARRRSLCSMINPS